VCPGILVDWLRAGDVIGEKYELTRRMGEGGMGVVWEAIHTTTNRRIALKILTSDLAKTNIADTDLSDSLRERREEVFARFEREARSTGIIDSEHVVQVLDAGKDRDSGRPYMAMELLTGEDLQHLAKRLGPLPPELALRIVAQVCRGLEKAHAAGIVHRDIKMANLFLAQRGGGRVVVKVLDFGIAKIKMDQFQGGHHEGLTQTGSMMGSPQYMSPEQAQGLKTIDHRSDIWSLGVVLYRSLCATPPFDAESVGQLILAICSDKPAPVQRHAPWVSPAVAEIVHRALRRNPAERFPSVTAMLDAISKELPHGADLTDDMLVPVADELRAEVAPRRQSSRPAGSADEVPTSVTPSAKARTGDSREPPTGITQTSVTTSTRRSGLGRRGRSRALLGALVVIGGAALAWRFDAMRSLIAPEPSAAVPAAADTPSQPPSAAPSTEPSVGIEAGTPTAQTVQLSIEPADAEVEVDGARAVVRSGAVEIVGPLGSTHSVRLRAAGREQTFEVAVADKRAFPAHVAIDAQRPPAATAGARGRVTGAKSTKPGALATATNAPAAPSPGAAPAAPATAARPPATTTPGVGAHQSFE
jgi:serine/threonine-protein kinase